MTGSLTAPLDCDVAVIGGGFTGLSAALHLAEGSRDTVVLEAGELGWGASGRNGGQVIRGFKWDPDQIVAAFGAEGGRALLDFARTTPDLVFDLIERHGIDCQAQRSGWLQPVHSRRALSAVAARVAQWQKHGADMELLSAAEAESRIGSPLYHGALFDPSGGTLQPLSYARGLARAALAAGAKIYSRSPARALTRQGGRWLVTTERASLRAERVVVATNGYSGALWPGLERSYIDARSAIIATAPLGDNLAAGILPGGQGTSDTRRLLTYLRRDPEGRLLVGGRGGFRDPRGRQDFAHLEKAMYRIFPQLPPLEVQYRWSGRICITRDFLPHIHEPSPGLVIALGYSGRGVAMASALGKAVAETLAGDAADYPLPVTALRPLPFYPLRRLTVAGMTAYYRLRDMVG